MEKYKTVEENYQRYRDARYSSHFIEESFIGFIDNSKSPIIQYDNSISKTENLKKIFSRIINTSLSISCDDKKIIESLYNCEFNNMYDIFEKIDTVIDKYFDINYIHFKYIISSSHIPIAKNIISLMIRIFIAESLNLLFDCQTGKIINNIIYFRCFNNYFVLKYTIKTKEGNIQECKLKFDLQEKHLYDLSKEKINFKILKTMNEFINMRLINWWETNLPKIQN